MVKIGDRTILYSQRDRVIWWAVEFGFLKLEHRYYTPAMGMVVCVTWISKI